MDIQILVSMCMHTHTHSIVYRYVSIQYHLVILTIEWICKVAIHKEYVLCWKGFKHWIDLHETRAPRWQNMQWVHEETGHENYISGQNPSPKSHWQVLACYKCINVKLLFWIRWQLKIDKKTKAMLIFTPPLFEEYYQEGQYWLTA